MPTLSPRALDDAVERRWPRLFRQHDQVATTQGWLKFALVLQFALATVMLLGPPYDSWAATLIGATIGILLWTSLLDPRRCQVLRASSDRQE